MIKSLDGIAIPAQHARRRCQVRRICRVEWISNNILLDFVDLTLMREEWVPVLGADQSRCRETSAPQVLDECILSLDQRWPA